MIDRHSLRIALPSGYRVDDVLTFHRRDAQETAERVREACVEKALVWLGMPARLTICFNVDGMMVDAVLQTQSVMRGETEPAFVAMVQRMLGLTQSVEAFEANHGSHPQIGTLIALQAGLRVPAAATPFEALTWAITGQQISVHAALALRRRLIQAAGVQLPGGLYCYPGAAQLMELSEPQLRSAGFSRSKAHALLALAHAVDAGILPLDAWALEMPNIESLGQQLTAVRGIGPWTLNYALLRGFGWLDGSLHGDVAVRRSLQGLLGRPDAIGEGEARDWLKQFSPWRALVAAHLWARLSTAAM